MQQTVGKTKYKYRHLPGSVAFISHQSSTFIPYYGGSITEIRPCVQMMKGQVS